MLPCVRPLLLLTKEEAACGRGPHTLRLLLHICVGIGGLGLVLRELHDLRLPKINKGCISLLHSRGKLLLQLLFLKLKLLGFLLLCDYLLNQEVAVVFLTQIFNVQLLVFLLQRLVIFIYALGHDTHQLQSFTIRLLLLLANFLGLLLLLLFSDFVFVFLQVFVKLRPHLFSVMS